MFQFVVEYRVLLRGRQAGGNGVELDSYFSDQLYKLNNCSDWSFEV